MLYGMFLHLFSDLYKETIIRNPKKVGSLGSGYFLSCREGPTRHSSLQLGVQSSTTWISASIPPALVCFFCQRGALGLEAPKPKV